ncbi:MAG: amino acid ABC transporter ATP-binding protein [Candidatus Micrarchaeota archaeon]|nr:amino acid ABC transporter ATP-binding protein [Candidatus Micrarchaeota archaeon]
MPKIVLHVKNLMKSFGDNKVLDRVTFPVKRGKVTVLMGPSGSGKTVLLKCIKGLLKPDRGNIVFSGDMSRIGLVFQDFNVWHNMTVLENIMLAPLIVQKRDKNPVYSEAMEILEKVELADKAGSYPHELSGGQKQRVAIARELMMKPDVLLLDEVTSALDPELAKSVLKIITKLAKDGMTMVLVTHDLHFAKYIGDHFIFLERGRIVEIGGLDIFRKPSSARTKEYLNSYFEF